MDLDKIRVKLGKVVTDLGFESEIQLQDQDDMILFNLEVENPALLIGRDGEGLLALQHIIRLLAGHDESNDEKLLVVDINGYRERQMAYLERSVGEAILRLKNKGDSWELSPMSSFDRLMVHRMINKHEGLESKSSGEGERRRVVIRKI